LGSGSENALGFVDRKPLSIKPVRGRDPDTGSDVRGKSNGSSSERFAASFGSNNPLPGLVPGTHVLSQR